MPTVPVPVGVEMVIAGHTLSVTVRVPVQFDASVAVNVSDTPAPLPVVGVPETTPVLAFKLKPAGSVPLVSVNE